MIFLRLPPGMELSSHSSSDDAVNGVTPNRGATTATSPSEVTSLHHGPGWPSGSVQYTMVELLGSLNGQAHLCSVTT